MLRILLHRRKLEAGDQWKATVINQGWNTNGLETGKEVTQWELFGLGVKDEFQVPGSNSWKRNRTSIICEKEGNMGPKDGVRKTSFNHTENKCECPCSIPSVGKTVPNLYPTQIWISSMYFQCYIECFYAATISKYVSIITLTRHSVIYMSNV